MTSRSLHVWLSCAVLVVAVDSAGAQELRRRGLMGIMLQPVTEQAQQRLGLDSTDGVLINGTRPDSPAEQAGLKADDVVMKIGDNVCKSIADLQTAMRRYYAGDTINITVLREGKPTTVPLTLIPRPMETSDEYEIAYDSIGKKGRRARTIITKPKEGTKFPAIMFIQGLSPQSVEVGLFPRHPYKSLIGEFNEAGFVTMRVDRLGVGDSEGADVNTTTVSDDVACFRAGVDKLGTYDFVDPEKVFIFSHSSGGAIAPMVAAGSKAKGVIAWAAFARPWMEHAMASTKRQWQLELREEDEINRDAAKVVKFWKLCFFEKQSPNEVLTSHPDLEELIRPRLSGDGLVDGVPYGYWQELVAIDASKEWPKVDTHVLALWGESDFAASRACGEAIAKYVNGSHAGKGTFTSVPGVGHMWGPAEDQEEAYLAGPSGEFAPAVMKTITDWVKKVS